MAATVHGWIKPLMEVGENGEQFCNHLRGLFFPTREPMEKDNISRGKITIIIINRVKIQG
jgi:hypothetical protein